MAQIFQRQHLAAALLASGLLVIAAYSAVTLAERRQGDASGAYAEASSLRRRLFGDTTTEAAQQQPAKLPAAFSAFAARYRQQPAGAHANQNYQRQTSFA